MTPTIIYFRVIAFALVVSVALSDLYLLVAYGENGTISQLLRDITNAWPLFGYLFAFAFGAFFYHILGPRC